MVKPALDAVQEQEQLEHQLQGDSEIEVGHRLHRYPHVVLRATIHAEHLFIAIAMDFGARDFPFDKDCATLKVMNLVVE